MLSHYYQELLNYFARMVRSRDTAADLVHEAYARVLALQRSGRLGMGGGREPAHECQNNDQTPTHALPQPSSQG